jgi:hypothetical protein
MNQRPWIGAAWTEQGVRMEIVGIIATVVVGLLVLTALIALVVSLPDIRRYFRIRAM